MNDNNPQVQKTAAATLNGMINTLSLYIAATDKLAASAAAKADHYGESNPVFYHDQLTIEGLRDGLRTLQSTNISVLEQHKYELTTLTAEATPGNSQ